MAHWNVQQNILDHDMDPEELQLLKKEGWDAFMASLQKKRGSA